MGVALPQNALTTDATEFIGYLVSNLQSPHLSNAALTKRIVMSFKQHNIDRVVWYFVGWPHDKQLAHHGLPIQRPSSNFAPVCYWL